MGVMTDGTSEAGGEKVSRFQWLLRAKLRFVSRRPEERQTVRAGGSEGKQ